MAGEPTPTSWRDSVLGQNSRWGGRRPDGGGGAVAYLLVVDLYVRGRLGGARRREHDQLHHYVREPFAAHDERFGAIDRRFDEIDERDRKRAAALVQGLF